MTSNYLFRLVHFMFLGFAISGAYLAVAGAAVWLQDPEQLPPFAQAFIVSFNCLLSGGIVFGIGAFVFFTQSEIPKIAEESFGDEILQIPGYRKARKKYLSKFGAATFSANYVVASFFLFYFCKFPLSGAGQYIMIAFACAQYAVGVYVGRKIYFIAYMLNALMEAKLVKNIFRETEFSVIMTYINIITTLTVVGLYVHVAGFYNGPFVYDSLVGKALRIGLLFPVIIAVPVLVVFNFYPRIVLRKLYARAIENEVEELTAKLADSHMSEREKMSFLVEYDRLAKEEAKGRLQLSLSDLPMGITIVVMIVGVLTKL